MKASSSFLCRFASILFSALLIVPPIFAQPAAEKPVVQGTFLGDGKDGKIQFLIVQAREPFNDKPAIRLIFTEQNPASSKKPDFDAGFKKLGSALIISAFEDGQIFGCEVAHSAHAKSPFSAIGEIKIENMQVTDKRVSGRVTTNGERDAFDQKWNVDLTFSAPLPKDAFAAAAEPVARSGDEAEPTPSGPKMAIAKLPLPSSATNVEYKHPVEQISFESPMSVDAVAREFASKLKQQGWKDGGGGVTTKTNAILKRELDGAELTIMIQAAGKGSTTKVFTEGLDWTNTLESKTAKPKQESVPIDPEAEADRLIKDALKQIPAGF